MSTQEISSSIDNLPLRISPKQREPIAHGFDSTCYPLDNDLVIITKPLTPTIATRLALNEEYNIDEVILSRLSEYFPRKWGKLIWGSNRKEAEVATISKKVNGSELSKLPLAYTLSNSIYVANLIGFLEAIKSVYKDTGIVIDTTGVRKSNSLNTHLAMLNPLQSSNIMIDDRTGKVYLVDQEPYYSKSIAKTSKIDRLALAKAITISWDIALSILRNAQRYQEKQLNKSATPLPERIRKTGENIEHIIEFLEVNGMKYFVTGSYALAAMLQEKGITYHSSAKIFPQPSSDIDIVLLSEQAHLIERVMQFKKTYNQSIHKSKFGPKLSIRIPGVDDSQKYSKRIFPNPSYTSIHIEKNGTITLIYKDISVSIGSPEIQSYKYNHCKYLLKTLTPLKQAILYLTRIGITKPKNAHSLNMLITEYNLQIPSDISEFMQRVRNTNPRSFRSAVYRETLSYWLKK